MSFSWPIRTRQARVPWSWVAMMSLPWATMLYLEMLSNVAVTFKVREFVSVPVLITLLGSFNLFFSVFVGSACNYASDRIWTRMGRRKPFLLAGWIAAALGCLVLPEVRTLWLLVALVFFHELLRDFATPYETLCNEVVPPPQRGRANAAFTFARNGMIAFFFAVMVGRWDETYTLPGGFAISGQEFVFWIGSLLTAATALFVLRGIHEERPPAPPVARPAGRGGVVAAVSDFLRDIFGDRQWLALYAIGIAQQIFWLDFGSLGPLLYTEQWGFTKQAYGNVLAIATGATLCVFLPLGGWLSDRLDRIRLFVGLAAAMALTHLLFFLYLKLVAASDHPSFDAVLAFRLVSTGVGTVGTIASVSLMFDYVPRDRLGTVLAGVALTRNLSSLLINNGVGLWVTALAWLLPRARAANGDICYDYASGYLYLAVLGGAAAVIAAWFARQTRAGRLVKLGVLETEPQSETR
jgi:MFS family permease